MNFKPIDDRILVQESAKETLTASGFVIPDSGADAVNRGTVLAVGPGKAPKKGGAVIPVDVKPGDKILYVPGSGNNVTVGGKPYLILKEEEVIATVNE